MALVKFICAVTTRSLFILISLIAIWRVTWVKNNSLYWFLTILFVPLLVEMIVTLKRRKGMDYTWFSPTIFFFLLSIVPSMWILELHHQQNKSGAPQCSKLEWLFNNSLTTGNITVSELQESVNAICPNNWILALHQILLILLIVGKWLLPISTGVTRVELSQMLLTFVGTAADILEFTTETFSDVKSFSKERNTRLVYVILAVWTWSMLQFPHHLSAVSVKTEEQVEAVDDSFVAKYRTDLWDIVESLIIQDGPFLLVRLTVMAHYKVIHQMLMFFTIKNFLVVALNCYRLFVILQGYSSATKGFEPQT